jgi:hypothetical protein
VRLSLLFSLFSFLFFFLFFQHLTRHTHAVHRANNQKDEFKRVGKKAKIWGKPVTTTKDGRLLTSGWWGTRLCPTLSPPPPSLFVLYLPPPQRAKNEAKDLCVDNIDIGVGRHINYLGDILIAVGWTLPCGFSSLIVRHRPVVRVVLSSIHCFKLKQQ